VIVPFPTSSDTFSLIIDNGKLETNPSTCF
jgi:hypothetical protein